LHFHFTTIILKIFLNC